MKNLLIAGLMAFSVNAIANEKGNGGTVLECKDRVVLADFEEVKLRVGLRGKINILESEKVVSEQIQDVIERVRGINTNAASNLEKAVQDFLDSVYEIEDYGWTITPDIGPFPIPNGCVLKNTVMYIDNGPVEMQMNLYNRLPNTHKAGIIIHEAVYKMMRDRDIAESAVPARRVTAMLFAENPDQDILKSIVLKYLSPVPEVTTLFLDDRKVEGSRYELVIKGTVMLSEVNSDDFTVFPIGRGGTTTVSLKRELKIGDTVKVRSFARDSRVDINDIPTSFRHLTANGRVIQESTKNKHFITRVREAGLSVDVYFVIISAKMDKYINGVL